MLHFEFSPKRLKPYRVFLMNSLAHLFLGSSGNEVSFVGRKHILWVSDVEALKLTCAAIGTMFDLEISEIATIDSLLSYM